MSSEDAVANSVPKGAMVHEFVLHRNYTPTSDTQGSEPDMDFALPRYEIEEGENWLRLLQKEGRSILDDTQNTQELLDESQSSTVYPSIVALSNVGIVEAPSLDCFICIDLDGVTLAVKDMRNPSTSERRPSDSDMRQRRISQNTCSQLGLYRRQKGYWEVLQRRRLRILSPGDRICTSIEGGKPGGLCLEYQLGEKPMEEKSDSQSQCLLTQPQDQDDDDSSFDTNDLAQTRQSLPSQKLSIPGDNGDDDSDRTVGLEESNPLNGARAASLPSLHLLATQPDSDEETDVEKKEQKLDKEREASSEGINEKNISTPDAAAVVSRPGKRSMDRSSGVAANDASNSDDDTDAGEVGQNNDSIEDLPSQEKHPPAPNLEKLSEDTEGCKEATHKIGSTLLSDPIEDSDDETDTDGEKKASLANHLTTKVQRHERKEQASVSKIQREASLSNQHQSISDISKKPLHTGLQAVEFSPSLCADTEDPPESDAKFVGQESAPLLSPMKESTQDAASEKSVSLFSLAMDAPKPAELQESSKDVGFRQTRKEFSTQKPPDIEQEKTGSPMQVAESGVENAPARYTGSEGPIEPTYSKESVEAREIASRGGTKEGFSDQCNQAPWAGDKLMIPPNENNAIQENGSGLEKDTMADETEGSVFAPVNSGEIPIATSVENGEGTEKLGTSTFPPEKSSSATTEKQKQETANPIANGAAGTDSTLASKKKLALKRTRNSDISKSTSSIGVLPSSLKQEGLRSARKRRRASTDACLNDESPVRVLITGIELTESQKNVRFDF